MGPSSFFILVASVAALALQQHFGAGFRTSSIGLLAWLALANLPLVPTSVRPFISVIGAGFVSVLSHFHGQLVPAVVWAICALGCLVWREKPKVEFELM